MRRQGWAALCAVTTLVLSGCREREVANTWSNASGSVALSRDDSLLYVVDADNGILAVVDTARREKVSEVRVGPRPERVTVGPDDTVYVTNRGGRSVSVIRKGDAVEAARVPVGVEPTGMALSPDGSTLYVVNSAMRESAARGSLTAIDTGTLTARWELPLGEEPRGIALLENGRKAAVSLFRQGDVMTVDLSDANHPQVMRGGTDLLARANRPSAPGAFGTPAPFDAPLPVEKGPRSFRSRGMVDLLSAPDGRRLFAPVLWSREDPLGGPVDGRGPNPGDSMYGGGTPCGAAAGGGVVAAGLITFDTEDEAPRPVVDDLDECKPPPEEKPDYPTSLIASPLFDTPLQGPAAAVVDPTGAWLFLVNQDSNNVAILPSWRRSGSDLVNETSPVRQLVAVGAGPNGIALTRDGRKAYVYNAFDHTVSTLGSSGDASGDIREEGERLVIAGDTLSPMAAAGRRLFFSAVDARMTSPAVAVSCASCHLEGREDGHVWGFPDGPRQTPSLAGRMTTATAPFHWSGEFSALGDFMSATVKDRMGGQALDEDTVAKLGAFIDAIPATDNASRGEPLTASQARGAALFTQAKCDTCHTGAALTDNRNVDVGTFVLSGVLQDAAAVIKAGLNTPSLLGVGRTAPYLHDGSAPTLKARLLNGRETNLHGMTAQLSDADVDDLVAYLETL
ncbi:cytochrome c peroxidase [Corallococcus coralloides]|uniref:Cytochrome c peroxidase n=1 Tax=Corallococcus coralloides TaxID=184914 RepID=A0A410RLS5_CORCK|nr:c-type cytochrome [Corallococcus coralloides]QAT82826.1 cytochrome c peroxidase [Corallococcus coralloides]